MIGNGLVSANAIQYGGKTVSTWLRWVFFLLIGVFPGLSLQAQQTDPAKPQPNRTAPAKPKVLTPQKPKTTNVAPAQKGTGTHTPANATHPPTVTKPKKVQPKDTQHVHVVRKPAAIVAKKVVRKAIDTASILDGPQAAAHTVTAKPTDTTQKNAVPLQSAKTAAKKAQPFVRKADPLWEKTISVPYLPLKSKAVFTMDEPHHFESKDLLFYIVCGLFLAFGIVRSAFPRYFDGLFQNLVSFSIMDRQETNLGQNNLPSLLLNILFCISLGLMATLILTKSTQPSLEFWRIWLIISGALAIIYLVKYLTISISGWIFNAPDDAHVYTYVVFSVNKVIGIACLPAILIFAFADQPQWNMAILTIGGIVLACLLLYRYIVTFSVIARNLQLNAFHFFLYLCSVEIIPILLLYKLFFKDLVHWI